MAPSKPEGSRLARVLPGALAGPAVSLVKTSTEQSLRYYSPTTSLRKVNPVTPKPISGRAAVYALACLIVDNTHTPDYAKAREVKRYTDNMYLVGTLFARHLDTMGTPKTQAPERHLKLIKSA